MGQEKARHLAAWSFTIAFELAAGVLSQWQAWTVVTVLFWMGAIALLVGYLPDLKDKLAAGKILGLEFLRQAAISFVMLCAFYFGTIVCATLLQQWLTPSPHLFEPEAWAIQNRAFVDEKPSQLMDYFNKYTQVTASKMLSRYLGKWYAITGPVEDVTDFETTLGSKLSGIKNTDIVYLARKNSSPLIVLQFEDRWQPEIDVLNKGDVVSAYCQIEKINNYSISLNHCQLVRR